MRKKDRCEMTMLQTVQERLGIKPEAQSRDEKREALACEIESGIVHFYGTENHYRNFTGLKYTDGIQWLAETAGAYWLIDAIGSHYCLKRKLKAEPFLVVRLTVDHREPRPEFMARLTFHTDWNDGDAKVNPSICTQRIPYTDFPLKEIKLYLCDGVLMLPGEY